MTFIESHIPWNKGKKTGIITGGSWKKGQKSWNKGMKGYTNAGSFKEGHQSLSEPGINPMRSAPFKKKLRIAGRPKPNNCEICHRTGRICFDHDHQTGKFRGWICVKCNAALGMADDSQEILIKLIIYLNKNK